MRALAFSAFVVIAAAALAGCDADYPQNSAISDPQDVAPNPPAPPIAQAAAPATVPDLNVTPARASGPPRSLLVPPPR